MLLIVEFIVCLDNACSSTSTFIMTEKITLLHCDWLRAGKFMVNLQIKTDPFVIIQVHNK